MMTKKTNQIQMQETYLMLILMRMIVRLKS